MVNVQSRLDVVVKARAEGLTSFDDLNRKVSKFRRSLRGINFLLRVFGLSLTTVLGGALVRGLIRQQEELSRSLGRTRFFLSGFVEGTERGLLFANAFAESAQRAGLAVANLAREIGAKAIVALKDEERATRFATAALVGHKLQLFDATAALNALSNSTEGNTQAFRTFLAALGIAAPEFASLETLIENFIRRNEDATQELTEFSMRWTEFVGTIKEGAGVFGGIIGELLIPVLQLATMLARIPKAFVDFLLNPSRESFFELINIAGAFARKINRILLDAFLTIFEGIAKLFIGFGEGFVKIWLALTNLVSNLAARFIGFLADLFFTGLRKIQSIVASVLKAIRDFFSKDLGLTAAINNNFAKILVGIWNFIADGISNAVDNIISAIDRIVSPIRNAINIISELISKISEFIQESAKAAFSGISGFVQRLIPGADGGIVTRPTAMLVGEAGPEAIIPLDRLGAGGGIINLTFTGNTFMSDEDAAVKIGDMIVKRLQLVHRIGLTT